MFAKSAPLADSASSFGGLLEPFQVCRQNTAQQLKFTSRAATEKLFSYFDWGSYNESSPYHNSVIKLILYVLR